MKHLLRSILLAVALTAAITPATARSKKKADTPPVKYVFYMIGDGMGINQVLATEQYNAATGNGPASINFFHFPVRNFITTVSASSLVTDSAAGGTALSSGVKTYNNAVGVDMDKKPVSFLTEWAKAAGYGTGIATSVGINHATPACFSAHAEHRGNYEEIAFQLLKAPIDFAAGAAFLTERGTGHDSAFFETEARSAGIKVFKGPEAFKGIEKEDGRIICLSGKTESDLPYAIDRKEDDTTLSDFVTAGIAYLDARYGDKGFFFMIEGGKIDYGGHGDDGAACFQELTDFANAMDIVLAFQAKHPDETLIVVTADHETGGLELGSGQYEMHPDLLGYQKMSTNALTAQFRSEFFPQRPQGDRGQGRPQGQEGARPPFAPQQEYTPPTWDQVKDFFRENLGLWGPVAVSESQEAALKETYERTFGFGGDRENNVANLYAVNTRLVTEAVDILNRAAGFQWSHGAHTGSPVGLYVKGKCEEAFIPVEDNAQIAPLIATLAGYQR
ncbi:MAG: alkaline phosphatase [Bacteroidales bacterium]|nr:alkaline phosphatase [Bacteroidales bacterium]